MVLFCSLYCGHVPLRAVRIMAKTLTKLEQKNLGRFLSSGNYSQLEYWLNSRGNYTWLWGGEYDLVQPMTNTIDNLLIVGLLERVDIGVATIRASKSGLQYKCRNCYDGKLYDADTWTVIDTCPVCNGTQCIRSIS
jgi:hypothetical protein